MRTTEITLDVNGFKITYERSGEDHIVTMIPGRMLTLCSRKVRSHKSTDTVPSELKAWEKIGRFNEIAKNANQND